MDKEIIKANVAQNIVEYRKLNNMSQLELAEKINYSDKSVSKWERGEALPDVILLAELAELFGVTLNDMTSEHREKQQMPIKDKKHLFITLMSVGVVWLVASISNFFFDIFSFYPLMSNIAFIYAIPVTFIVAVVFAFLWFNRIIQFISVSLLTWALTICAYITVSSIDMRSLFIIALVFQVILVLWYVFMQHFDAAKAE